MNTFLLAAILAQSLDAYSTCSNLSTGRFKEVTMPFKTCKTIVLAKGATVAGIFYFPIPSKAKKVLFSVQAGMGSVGFTINVSRR